MPTRPDDIASCVLAAYAALPPKGKPTRRDGRAQWTVLAGFAMSRPGLSGPVCVSLGTGVKCVPLARYSEHGDLLHDSHAEVIARRSLIVWLLDELKRGESDWLEPAGEAGRWRLREGVEIHLYISTAPCERSPTICG